MARQRAVALFGVPGLEARPLRERERHGAVARGPAAELELAPDAAQAEHRVLAEAGDEAEALVRRRQVRHRVARILEQARSGLRPVGPLVGIEGIEFLAEVCRGQEIAEPGKVVSIWRASSSALCLRSSIATRRISG